MSLAVGVLLALTAFMILFSVLLKSELLIVDYPRPSSATAVSAGFGD